MVIRMFIKVRRKINEQSEKRKYNRDRKYEKVSNRNHRAEEYNNWTEKFNSRVGDAKKRSANLKTSVEFIP